jgi:hypothetical protein
MLATKLLSAMAGGGETLYVDDVFSAYTYTGNGSTQTITNGIDLAGKGGLVWLKIRSPNAYGHYLFDTVRGASQTIRTESTGGQTTTGAPITFNSNGFALAYAAGWNENVSTFVGFTFRKAPKFFDVVTWTGNATNRTISHALGQEVGLIFVKRTDTTADWQVYHRSLANTEYMVLNSTAAKATGATRWNSTTPTTSVFSVGTDATVNASGGTYVAYLFAHDTAADGIVQCGSFTTDGIGNATVNLGWEPQYVMLKQTNAANNWQIFDTSRAFTATYGTAKELDANLNSTEYTYPTGTFKPTATGFQAPVGFLSATATYIYLAIRRPNKPPTVGTQVYNAIARTGTGAAATVTGVGFAPDLVALRSRSGTTGGRWEDRLRGATIEISSNATTVEAAVAQSLKAFGMDGFALGTDGDWNTSAATYISWCFKRAPGVFDQVCYTGTGVAKTEAHGLGVVPELMIVKSRLATGNWAVYNSFEGATEYTFLNTTDASAGPVSSVWNNTAPTTSVFTVGTSSAVNTAVVTYVAYLFATKAGISKVGSYTGTATTNAIDCGFTTGARFVLIKRTDSTGDWYVWDTVRGIIAGNDPYLLLNSTAAEVTSTDYIDPYTSGFELSSTAPAAINASGGTFIFLALS